jgi:4-hydroxybenzoate polyprenyltransferase
MRDLFLALRPSHWIKNLFILLPLVFGKKLFVSPENLHVILAFLIFSMAASSGYLLNDIIDYPLDKKHRLKRLRPIISGKVSIKNAFITACALAILSLLFSFLLNIYFGWLIVAYFLLNLIYTKMLKDLVIIDIFCIGAFFLLRIMSGSVVAGVVLSHWIIFMTVFLALFLGFNKRRQELAIFDEKLFAHRNVLSKYNTYFIDQMISIVTSSIVIFYMLYTVDSRTIKEFGNNHLLLGVPFVYYGIFRYLYLVHKENKGDDPTNVLLSDIPMQINLILWLAVCICVIYGAF